MLAWRAVKANLVKTGASRCYGCCPPRGPCCPCPAPGGGRQPKLPPDCRTGGHVPPNPCMPMYHHGKDSWKRYRNFFFCISLPLIIIQSMHALSHSPPHKTECRDYEYMRRRTKRFPWGSGQETFFHNPDVNFLPGECEPPPLDCD